MGIGSRPIFARSNSAAPPSGQPHATGYRCECRLARHEPDEPCLFVLFIGPCSGISEERPRNTPDLIEVHRAVPTLRDWLQGRTGARA